MKNVIGKLNKVFNSKQSKVVCLLLTTIVMTSASSVFAVDFDVKGTNVTIGGKAKVQAIYDINNRIDAGPTEGDVFCPYLIALDGTTNSEKDDFRMVARESRLKIKTVTENEFGKMETVISADFYGDIGNETWSNSRALRIREAYGKVTNGRHVTLGGQTWSTFMDLWALPSSMDLSVDPGVTFVRQTMIRYQYNIDKGQYFNFAIENPNRGLTALGPGMPLFLNAGDSQELMPDIIAKYFYSGKWGHISPKLLLRRFELDDDVKMGWGVSLTGHINLGKGHIAQAGVVYGDGLGRYLSLGAPGGAGLTSTNEVETVKSLGAWAGTTFSLSKTLRWTVGLGYSENDDDAYIGKDAVLTGLANKNVFGCHTNIKWRPSGLKGHVPPPGNWEYALGFVYGDIETMDGREGDARRIQLYASYVF